MFGCQCTNRKLQQIAQMSHGMKLGEKEMCFFRRTKIHENGWLPRDVSGRNDTLFWNPEIATRGTSLLILLI
jgi:hypothetical protein